MNRKNNGYYPKDKLFTEILVTFLGDRMKTADVMCYLKLKSLTKRLNMIYPNFIINSDFFSYGNSLRYSCRTILEDNTEKRDKVKAVCNELIKYGIKNKSIPMIEFISCGEKITRFQLADYLKSKEIKLEDLNIEEMILDEKNLDESR